MTADHQRKLAAYYTPEEVTDILSRWAIRTADDTILEPSFGGCNFLTSSVKALLELGATNPYQHIYGFDIDSAAFKILREKNLYSANFFFKDFLDSQVGDFPETSAILGNPPYVPVHKLDQAYKQKIFKQFKRSAFTIPRRSSLWIYFIVHSFQYLRNGGRMAWVVPDSIAFTEYGKRFLQQLGNSFRSVKVIRIEERYFANSGTKEKTSFLLCEGYNSGHCQPVQVNYKQLKDALMAVEHPDVSPAAEALVAPTPSMITTNSKFLLTQLGHMFTIRIGIVIGAASLLVFNDQQATASEFHPKFTYPLVTKGKQLNRLTIDKRTILEKSGGLPIYVVDGLKLEEENPELFEKLVRSIPEKVMLNQTFKKRQRLFAYDDFLHPDAFLTFYAQGLPKFVINKGKELNCTNSVHRLYAKDTVDETVMKLIALQLLGGVFAENIHSLARPYGNSIRKFEPSDASKIPLVIPVKVTNSLKKKTDACFEIIEKNLDLGNLSYARSFAKDFLINLIR